MLQGSAGLPGLLRSLSAEAGLHTTVLDADAARSSAKTQLVLSGQTQASSNMSVEEHTRSR